MALCKTGNEIISIRGRFGGTYFKTDGNSVHQQAMPRRVQYQAEHTLGLGAEGFSTLATIWMLILLGAMAVLWTAYAAANKFKGKDGKLNKITGYMWYIHFNMMHPELQGEPLWEPPRRRKQLPHFYGVTQKPYLYDHGPWEWTDGMWGGYFWYHMPVNGKPAFSSDKDKWRIWWKDPMWVCSPEYGFEPDGLTYYSKNDHIWDYYYNPITKKRVHIQPADKIWRKWAGEPWGGY